MHELLTAAQKFHDTPPCRLKLYDLGLARFLEGFSWPVLCGTNYVPLKQRQLLPDMATELSEWFAPHLRGAPSLEAWLAEHSEDHETVELIGRGLQHRMMQRHRNMRGANRIGILALLAAFSMHGLVWGTMAVTGALWLGVGWLMALGFASIICVSNRHCGDLLAGFRRVPRTSS